MNKFYYVNKQKRWFRRLIIIYLFPTHLFSGFCGFSSLLYKLSILCGSWLSKIKSISYTSKERLLILIFFLLLLFGWNYEFFASIVIIGIFMYKSWWLWREACIIRRGQWHSPKTHLCMILEQSPPRMNLNFVLLLELYVMLYMCLSYECASFFSVFGVSNCSHRLVLFLSTALLPLTTWWLTLWTMWHFGELLKWLDLYFLELDAM